MQLLWHKTKRVCDIIFLSSLLSLGKRKPTARSAEEVLFLKNGWKVCLYISQTRFIIIANNIKRDTAEICRSKQDF